MAKKQSTIYELKIAGEYFANIKGGTELRPYEVTVKMNEEHKKQGFLSVFKNLVAPRIMPGQFPDYAGSVYTHRIVSIIDTAKPNAVINEPLLMTGPQVIAFIEKNDLPVQIALYKDEDELKQAVVDCLEDEESFVEAQAKRKELRGANVELANQLAELNPGMGSGPSLSESVESAKDVDQSQVPDAADAVIPEKPQAQSDTDKVTVDASNGGSKVEGEDDFDI